MRLILIALGMMVTAASAQEPTLPKDVPVVDGAIVCGCADQCAAMWSTVESNIEQFSGMRIRLDTGTLIETYATQGAGQYTGTAHKSPMVGQSYRIDVSFVPYYPSLQSAADGMAGVVLRMAAMQSMIHDCPAPR